MYPGPAFIDPVSAYPCGIVKSLNSTSHEFYRHYIISVRARVCRRLSGSQHFFKRSWTAVS
ncbi:MAG: hypothetical protein DRH32_05115 [Deltaproteobacteria bacterium]|nr:MAG: hypothetical protein DRH32_05115 [Deltaproteobacteria bacterium]